MKRRRSLPGLCVKLPETSCFDRIFNGKVLRALRREVNTGEGLFCACLKFSLIYVHTLTGVPQKTEQHSITTSPDFPSDKKVNFSLYHERNQEIFVQDRRLFNTLTSGNFHGIFPPLSKENFKKK